MRAQSAAPEASQASGRGYIDGGNRRSIADTGLPAHVVARLEGESVTTLDEWRALGRRRYSIFGITRRVAGQPDALARGRP